MAAVNAADPVRHLYHARIETIALSVLARVAGFACWQTQQSKSPSVDLWVALDTSPVVIGPGGVTFAVAPILLGAVTSGAALGGRPS